jgi:hypothetical protein
MANELPPSGRWTGYYLYGHCGPRHRMTLTLAFRVNGAIDGEGLDDIAPFLIRGGFDVGTKRAFWTKQYVGMHTVEYSGLYCQRAICGDWAIMGDTGGFWIWPESEPEWEQAVEDVEIAQALVMESSHEPDPIPKVI